MAAWARKAWSVFVLVTTIYAWSAAVHTAIRLERDYRRRPAPHSRAACAPVPSAPGSTQLGCSLFSSELRRPWRIGVTCAMGAVAGPVVLPGERKMLDERLLYLVWQPLVAFCIGLGLPRQGQGQST